MQAVFDEQARIHAVILPVHEPIELHASRQST